MPQDKPPFKLTINLESYRPDALNSAVERLRELCEEHDQTTGEMKTKIILESWKEEPLLAIRAQIETYLRHHKLLLDGKATIESPIVRPRPELTPMEEAIERLRPKAGDGMDAVELSAGGRTVRLEPK